MRKWRACGLWVEVSYNLYDLRLIYIVNNKSGNPLTLLKYLAMRLVLNSWDIDQKSVRSRFASLAVHLGDMKCYHFYSQEAKDIETTKSNCLNWFSTTWARWLERTSLRRSQSKNTSLMKKKKFEDTQDWRTKATPCQVSRHHSHRFWIR